MKIILLVALFFPLRVLGQSFAVDSMLNMIWQGKSAEVLRLLKDHPVEKEVLRDAEAGSYRVVHALAAFDLQDSIFFSYLRHSLLQSRLNTVEAQKCIRFIFSCGVRFVTRPDLFAVVQDLGFRISGQYGETRAQFSFLQQQFSMHQMSGRLDSLPDILSRMDALCAFQPYLQYRRDMNYGLYHAYRRQDSCAIYFDRMLSQAPAWIGKPNPHFINEPAFAAKMDSSVLAVAMMEYAKHEIRRGDLKKAGALLVESVRLVPDTSTFVVIALQNKLTLAMVYADLVNPTRARAYAEDAIALCETHQLTRLRKTQVAAVYAHILMAAGRYEEAKPELETAFREMPRRLNCQDPKRQALRMALNAALLRDGTSTRHWLDTANTIRCDDDPEIRYLQALVEGHLAALADQYQIAFRAFRQAEKEAIAVNAVSRRKMALYHQYLMSKSSGYMTDGLASLEKYTQLNDSLYRTGQDIALLDIQAEYQKTLQDETIARLDAQNAFAAATIHVQKRTLILSVGVILLVSLLLLQVFRLYRKVKESNRVISQSIAEKNILLREIHHRVKNNLQVISSLLKLQSGYVKDEAAVQAIAEGRSRVQSMALLHQNLYREENLTGVDMKDYFDHLIQGLFDTYNISPERIVLVKNISNISLDVDTVIPLGLITNELISNALKHAFPGHSTGHLYIDLFEEGNELILKVRDDGIGMTVTPSAQSFGNKLIQSLSQKLEADITTLTHPGTEVILRIRDYKKAA